MKDYAKMYHREHRIRVVQEERLRRIKLILRSSLPKGLALIMIFMITRKV